MAFFLSNESTVSLFNNLIKMMNSRSGTYGAHEHNPLKIKGPIGDSTLVTFCDKMVQANAGIDSSSQASETSIMAVTAFSQTF